MGGRLFKIFGPFIVAGLVLGHVSVAHAAVSFTTRPTSTLSWTLAATGPNSLSGGTFVVHATEPYTVTVVADVSRLTEFSGSTYTTPSRSIAAPLSVATASQSGAGVAVASVNVATSATTIATGVGTALAPANDTFSLTLSQATVITDPALASGRTYHMVLTYTAGPTL